MALAAGVGALLLLLLISVFSETPAEKNSLVDQGYESPRSLHTSSESGGSKNPYPPSPAHASAHGYRGELSHSGHHALPSPVGPPPVAPPGSTLP